MAESTWHYLSDQFDNATKQSRRLMNDILLDHHAKLAGALPGNAALGPMVAGLAQAFAAWQEKYGGWLNARVAYRAATQGMRNLFVQLRVQPLEGGRSKVDAWESQIAAHWARHDPVYDYLLPRGRDAFLRGSPDDVIGEVQRLGQRLAQKAGDLATYLASPEGQALPEAEQEALSEAQAMCATVGTRVAAFHGRLAAARTLQTQQEGLVDQLSGQVEPARVAAARAMHRNVFLLGALFFENLAEVEGFYDLALIKSAPAADAGA